MAKIKILETSQFKGLNTIDDPRVIDVSESPYMVNMDITRSGGMVTRFGYELAADIAGATGTMRGLLPYYRTIATTGDYLLLFHSNGHAYKVTNSSFTPVDLGSYGTDSGPVRGTISNNLAIFGNGLAANALKKWDGTTLADLGGTPPDGNIFATWAERFFISGTSTNPSLVTFSVPNNPEDTTTTPQAGAYSINIGDGQKVTGMVANNDFLQIFKEDSIYGFTMGWDENLLPEVTYSQIVTTQGGAYATGTVQPLYGYTFFGSKKGFESYGPNPQRIIADMPVPLSMKIDPTYANINWKYRDGICSTFYDNKYMCAVPFDQSGLNDYVFIYNENIKRRFGYDNWTVYRGIPAQSFALFRDSNNRDQLYFASNAEAKVFRFNSSFSDAGFGYDRIWRSKTFNFGERTRWVWIDIEGSITQNTTIYVDINTDNVQESDIEINSSNLITGTTGGSGYIGDNYVGDEYVGVATSSGSGTTPMYRFKKRIRIPDTVNYGNGMYFQLRNNADGQGWKLSKFKIAFEVDPDDPTYERVDN